MKRKNVTIETNRYSTQTGGTIINRSADPFQKIQVIPKRRFTNSYNRSFFVRRQIALRRLSVMMGFHPRLGKDSPFKLVLSKDVAR